MKCDSAHAAWRSEGLIALTMLKSTAVALCSLVILGFLQGVEPSGDPTKVSIINGTDWVDVGGRPIMAHEGDLARFNRVFYWYGSSYANNPKGKFRATLRPLCGRCGGGAEGAGSLR